MLNPYRDQVRPDATRDRRTLILLIGSTIAIGGFLIYALTMTQARKPQDDSPFTEQNDWGGSLGDRLGYEKISLPESLAAQIRERSEADRVLKEKEPFHYLLGEVADRPFRFFNEVGYTKVPEELTVAELAASPDRYRAEQFTVKGTLVSSEVKPLDLPAPVAEVWEGVLRIDDPASGDSSYVYFESVDEPQRVRPGQVALLYGIFFKNFSFTVEEDGASTFRDGPFFIARRVKRSYLYLDIQELDRNIARRVQDSTPAEKMIVEDEVFYHLASYAKNLDPEVVRSEHTEDADMGAVYHFPSRFRGEMVKFRGKLVQLEKVQLEDNPANLDAYYDGIVHTMDRITVRIRFVNKPTGIARGDLVSVRGLFMKTHKYESRAETAPEVPLIVGVTIDRIQFRDETLKHISVVLAAVAATLLIVFTVSLVLNRKGAREFEAAYWERKKNRIRKHGVLEQRHPTAGADPAGTGAQPSRDDREGPSSPGGGESSDSGPRDEVRPS